MTAPDGELPSEIAAIREELLTFALSLPEAWEDQPWGESVAKVRQKVFAFFGTGGGNHLAGMTVKLPESADHALSLPESSPTGYGLGRAGWVTIGLSSELPALDVLTDWIMESYRTVAPKSLASKLTCADE